MTLFKLVKCISQMTAVIHSQYTSEDKSFQRPSESINQVNNSLETDISPVMKFIQPKSLLPMEEFSKSLVLINSLKITTSQDTEDNSQYVKLLSQNQETQ